MKLDSRPYWLECLSLRMAFGSIVKVGIPVVFCMLSAPFLARAQCGLINPVLPSLVIEFDKPEKVEVDAVKKDGVILSLVNNTTCDVRVLTTSPNATYRPLSPKPTLKELLKREIDLDLPDKAYVWSLFFRYQTKDGMVAATGGGCTYFSLTLRAGRSLQFGVHLDHFLPKEFESWVEVPFAYAWESQPVSSKGSGNGTNYTVTFSNTNLPKDVQARIPAVRK